MQNNAHTPIRCIIVDDEPMARDVVRRYVEQVPSLHLAGEFGNAIEATMYLQQHPIDIIFLDIRMPQLNGVDFVKSLRKVPKIIFTTAYKEYALDGFELDVTDYLLKPIRFDRFLRAVNKAFPTSLQNADTTVVHAKETVDPVQSFIYLRADRKMIKVLLNQILYIESAKDYVKVFTNKGYVITRQTIAAVEAMLSDLQFVRIHRSFIISLQHIQSYTTETVEIANKELPIGKLYRQQFLKRQQG